MSSESLPIPRRIFPLLLTAVVTMAMGQTLVFALLPLLGREVGLRELQVGIIITASSIVYALATRVWGRRSDQMGRRRVILIGLAGYTVGTLVFTSFFWLGFEDILRGLFLWVALIVVRCLQSTVMAGTMPATNAYISDITTVQTRTSGLAQIGAANSIGTIIGPAVGGVLAGISLLAPLYFAAAMTFLALILVGWLLPESPQQLQQAGQPQHSVKLRYGDRRYRHLLIIATLMFIAFSVVQQTLGFYFQDALQLSSQDAAKQVGFALMLSAVLALVAQGVVVQRLAWPAWRLIIVGLMALTLGSLFLTIGGHAVLLYAGVSCCGFGIGLCHPGCIGLASMSVDNHEQGSLAGLTSALPALGSIVGPLLGTGLYEIAPYLTYAANLFILVAVLVYAWRCSRKPPGYFA